MTPLLQESIVPESSNPDKNPAIKLLEPVPEKLLFSWLNEFYGKEVSVANRTVLRHRDFSYVERIQLSEALPDSLIYKLVIPPWDIEQDLHERVLVPSISNSAQLYMTAHYGNITAMFMEDLGTVYMNESADKESCLKFAKHLARMHRAYSYRLEELIDAGILRHLSSDNLPEFGSNLFLRLSKLESISDEQSKELHNLFEIVRDNLKAETLSLVHGDLYAENVVLRGSRQHLIDWSWFTSIATPLIDLATITSDHPKNGVILQFKEEFLEAYCFESGRSLEELSGLKPSAHALERFLFLSWLAERKDRGIVGTTVGHVDELVSAVIGQIQELIKV